MIMKNITIFSLITVTRLKEGGTSSSINTCEN